MDSVRKFHDPELRNPVALIAFEGWNDASDAASGVIAYIIGQFDAEPFAVIDPEEFIDFHQTRPTVEVEQGITNELAWPATRAYAVHLGDRDHDLLLILGDEPQLRWQSFAQAVEQLLSDSGASQAVLLGAFLGQVPHTIPVPIIGTAGSEEELAMYGLVGADYAGPTGIVGVLSHLFRQAGLPTVSLWAAAPHYLGTNPNPKAMLALLTQAARVLDIPVDATELSEVAGEFEGRVDAAMSASTEFTEYVRRLEEAAAESSQSFDRADADELIAEVEQFLQEN